VFGTLKLLEGMCACSYNVSKVKHVCVLGKHTHSYSVGMSAQPQGFQVTRACVCS
jgi:hypothetical protein